MLETKYIGDNLKMSVTVLVILVTNIQYLLSPRSNFCHQFKSPAKRCHQVGDTNITVSRWSRSIVGNLTLEIWRNSDLKLEGSPWIKINKNSYLLFCDFSSRILRRKLWLTLVVSNGVWMSSKCKWVQKQGFEVRCSCLEYFIDVRFSLFTFKIIFHFTFWFL